MAGANSDGVCLTKRAPTRGATHMQDCLISTEVQVAVVDGDHDLSSLLCYLDAEPWDEAAIRFRSWFDGMQAGRQWAFAKPSFVDIRADQDWTLGVVLDLPSLEASECDPTIDALSLDDVEALVTGLIELSREQGWDLCFELNDDPVGAIDAGTPNQNLIEGLLVRGGASTGERRNQTYALPAVGGL